MAAKKKTVTSVKKGKFTALKTSNNNQEYSIVKCEDDVEESQEEDEETYTSPKRSEKSKSKQPQPASKETRPSVEEQQRYNREETERRLEENEQFIIELLSRTQPHHDHSYTTVFGKKKNFYNIEMLTASDEEVDSNEDDEETLKFYCGREIIRPKRIAEPILCLGNVSVMDELSGYGHDEASKTIIVCAEEIVGDHVESPAQEDPMPFKGHSGQSKYIPC